jgi:hypothetical protein
MTSLEREIIVAIAVRCADAAAFRGINTVIAVRISTDFDAFDVNVE